MSKKYLQQRFTEKGFARIFDWTELLAARPDMYPYDGPVPESRIVRLNIKAVAEKEAPPMMHFDSKKIIEPSTEVPETAPVISATDTGTAPITEKASVVEDEVASSPDDDVPPPIPPIPQLTGEAKIAKIAEIIKAFPKDEEHFTTQGLPKIDTLIHVLGQDVSSKERGEALKLIGDKK